ncbi:unnamed protein product [Dibothriocephalus latus]|uniref:Uncharacterized protein n=1 Tax=Dibothriocephalus latus TaxID=60516 RepID=A0A3P7M218_DIBLA|nr:unnamed protein product [Dibothriocephalus latus]
MTNGCPTWSAGLLALLRRTYSVYGQAFYNISVLDFAQQAISSGDFVELLKPYPELHEGSKFPDLCELRVSLYLCAPTCQNGLLSGLGFRLPKTAQRVEDKNGKEDEKDAEGEKVGPHNRGEHQDGGEKEDERMRANNGARSEAAESPVMMNMVVRLL